MKQERQERQNGKRPIIPTKKILGTGSNDNAKAPQKKQKTKAAKSANSAKVLNNNATTAYCQPRKLNTDNAQDHTYNFLNKLCERVEKQEISVEKESVQGKYNCVLTFKIENTQENKIEAFLKGCKIKGGEQIDFGYLQKNINNISTERRPINLTQATHGSNKNLLLSYNIAHTQQEVTPQNDASPDKTKSKLEEIASLLVKLEEKTSSQQGFTLPQTANATPTLSGELSNYKTSPSKSSTQPKCAYIKNLYFTTVFYPNTPQAKAAENKFYDQLLFSLIKQLPTESSDDTQTEGLNDCDLTPLPCPTPE
jgi:hypothetical protein